MKRFFQIRTTFLLVVCAWLTAGCQTDRYSTSRDPDLAMLQKMLKVCEADLSESSGIFHEAFDRALELLRSNPDSVDDAYQAFVRNYGESASAHSRIRNDQKKITRLCQHLIPIFPVGASIDPARDRSAGDDPIRKNLERRYDRLAAQLSQTVEAMAAGLALLRRLQLGLQFNRAEEDIEHLGNEKINVQRLNAIVQEDARKSLELVEEMSLFLEISGI